MEIALEAIALDEIILISIIMPPFSTRIEITYALFYTILKYFRKQAQRFSLNIMWLHRLFRCGHLVIVNSFYIFLNYKIKLLYIIKNFRQNLDD
jgi:hypothetical protein